jgi:hypothetical protein
MSLQISGAGDTTETGERDIDSCIVIQMENKQASLSYSEPKKVESGEGIWFTE